MIKLCHSIAADIVRKASCDALDFGVPLESLHVGCSYEVWWAGKKSYACSARLSSASFDNRAAKLNALASDVRDALNTLGFRW